MIDKLIDTFLVIAGVIIMTALLMLAFGVSQLTALLMAGVAAHTLVQKVSDKNL